MILRRTRVSVVHALPDTSVEFYAVRAVLVRCKGLLFICCTTFHSAVFLGHSGLSFDGEGRRNGRVETLE
jgi:hypothetical protein